MSAHCPTPGDPHELHYDLYALLRDHGEILDKALDSYIATLRPAAEVHLARYEAIKHDPAARAAQDNTIVTTEGLRLVGEMTAATIERAEAARRDLGALQDPDDADDADDVDEPDGTGADPADPA